MLGKRASKLSREPIPETASERAVIPWKKLTQTDLDIIETCHQYYASIPYLAALTGRTVDWIRKRTKALKRAPNLYIDICRQQRAKPKAFQVDFQLFRSTRQGVSALENRCRRIPHQFPDSSSFAHDVMVDEALLSLKIGLKHHPEVTLIDAHDILGNEKVSPATRADVDWHYFPISASHTKRKTAHPDDFPAGLRRAFDKPGEFPFFVIENETGANGIEREEYDNSAVASKLLSWLDVIKEENGRQPTYWTHIGLPILYVIFLCPPARVASTREMIGKYIPAKYQRYFLVKAHVGLPTGWMLELDFLRFNQAPLNLLTSRLD